MQSHLNVQMEVQMFEGFWTKHIKYPVCVLMEAGRMDAYFSL